MRALRHPNARRLRTNNVTGAEIDDDRQNDVTVATRFAAVKDLLLFDESVDSGDLPIQHNAVVQTLELAVALPTRHSSNAIAAECRPVGGRCLPSNIWVVEDDIGHGDRTALVLVEAVKLRGGLECSGRNAVVGVWGPGAENAAGGGWRW